MVSTWNIFIPLATLLPSLFPCIDAYFTLSVSGLAFFFIRNALTLSSRHLHWITLSTCLFLRKHFPPLLIIYLFACTDCLSSFPIAHFHFISSPNSMKSLSILLECLIYSRYSLEVWSLLMLPGDSTDTSSLTQETQQTLGHFHTGRSGDPLISVLTTPCPIQALLKI